MNRDGKWTQNFQTALTTLGSQHILINTARTMDNGHCSILRNNGALSRLARQSVPENRPLDAFPLVVCAQRKMLKNLHAQRLNETS